MTRRGPRRTGALVGALVVLGGVVAESLVATAEVSTRSATTTTLRTPRARSTVPTTAVATTSPTIPGAGRVATTTTLRPPRVRVTMPTSSTSTTSTSSTTSTTTSSTTSTTSTTTVPPVVLTVGTEEQGGSAIASASTTVGGTLADPGSPARAGFRFDGWFTSASGGTAVTFPYAHGQTSNFTLYAQWSVSDCGTGGDCRLGETGPGGGIIFYVHDDEDDYFTSVGSDCGTMCRYLEAEPAVLRTARWCSESTGLGVGATGLGQGMGNTTTARETCTSGAIYIAAEFENNGVSDWHLPSFDELELLYFARNRPGIDIGSPAAYYWSSTERTGGGSDGTAARVYRFSDGATNVSFSKRGFTDATSPRIHLVRASG